MRSARVFVNGIQAGRLVQERADSYLFTYEPYYVMEHPHEPVCLAMPVRTETYISPYLFPFFSNLLSEGSNRAFQTRLHHLDTDDDFSLLLEIAGYDTIGTVTVKPEA